MVRTMAWRLFLNHRKFLPVIQKCSAGMRTDQRGIFLQKRTSKNVALPARNSWESSIAIR